VGFLWVGRVPFILPVGHLLPEGRRGGYTSDYPMTDTGEDTEVIPSPLGERVRVRGLEGKERR